MSCYLGVPECSATGDRPRHRHDCHDLNQIGEACACGCDQWLIIFGGLLPARIQCCSCGAGFNLTQRLKDARRQESNTFGSNR